MNICKILVRLKVFISYSKTFRMAWTTLNYKADALAIVLWKIESWRNWSSSCTGKKRKECSYRNCFNLLYTLVPFLALGFSHHYSYLAQQSFYLRAVAFMRPSKGATLDSCLSDDPSKLKTVKWHSHFSFSLWKK